MIGCGSNYIESKFRGESDNGVIVCRGTKKLNLSYTSDMVFARKCNQNNSPPN